MGTPSLAEADALLADKTLSREEILKLSRAIASAWGRQPEEEATKNLEWLAARVLPNVSDAYGTNTHFCRSVVQFMETLVLATIGRAQ